LRENRAEAGEIKYSLEIFIISSYSRRCIPRTIRDSAFSFSSPPRPPREVSPLVNGVILSAIFSPAAPRSINRHRRWSTRPNREESPKETEDHSGAWTSIHFISSFNLSRSGLCDTSGRKMRPGSHLDLHGAWAYRSLLSYDRA